EIGGCDLAAVDERQHEPVRQERAEFFHEIQGERRAPRAVNVEIAYVGIEAGGDERGGAVRQKQGVSKREESIGPVEGRAAGTSIWGKVLPLLSNHRAERLKEDTRRGAL